MLKCFKFCKHLHNSVSEQTVDDPSEARISLILTSGHPHCEALHSTCTSSLFAYALTLFFFYSYIIYFIRKHCHSLSIPPHPGIHFYFHLLVSFLLPLNKQLTSSPLLCLCSLACQSASSEFNYPTVVLWCCLVSWWRIHYLITPLDKTVTTLSLPFIPLLTLRLQIYSLALLSSPVCDLHCHLLQTPAHRWDHRALSVLEFTQTLLLWSWQKLRCFGVFFSKGHLTSDMTKYLCTQRQNMVVSTVCVAKYSSDYTQLFFAVSNVRRTVKLQVMKNGRRKGVRDNPKCVNHKQWL